ncbi:MAG: hypothetical protein R3320_04100 [Nitriliruptorales bacterium]|nr:hypothetical protein [Nitriliruptorales bacterium]
MLGRYDEVRHALEALPGVAAASVGEGHEPGRGQLKIRLAAGHDAREVSRAVSGLLRQRFGITIHPSDIRPRTDVEVADDGHGTVTGSTPSMAAATAVAASDTSSDSSPDTAPSAGTNGTPAGDVESNGHRSERAAIRDLVLSVDGLEVTAVTVLDVDGTEITGRATGAATDDASLRTIARATLDAVDHLVPGRAKTDLELVAVDGHGDSRRVTVTAVYLTPRGEERLAGVSLVGDGDVHGAVVRAALDAVNRRVEALLSDQPAD